MSTIRDIIKITMQKMGVLAAGEDVSDQDGDDARAHFALMVDGMATHPMITPIVTVVSKVLVVGQADYTIGIYPAPAPDPLPSNHIEGTQPVEYLSAFIRDASGTDCQIRMIPQNEYASISRKLISARPSQLYVQQGWPLTLLRLDTAPHDTEQLFLTVKKPLADFIATSTINTEINLPPGYEQMFIYNLYIELASTWSKPIPAEVAYMARETMRRIKQQFNKPGTLKFSSHLTSLGRGNSGTYDITGGP